MDNRHRSNPSGSCTVTWYVFYIASIAVPCVGTWAVMRVRKCLNAARPSTAALYGCELPDHDAIPRRHCWFIDHACEIDMEV